MDHVAIMKKSWRLLPKILSGEKKIESRWYKNMRSPWGKINKGDVVYFKNSGEPITVKALVSIVLHFSGLDYEKIKEILSKYNGNKGLGVSDPDKYYELFKEKNYCLLIFLENPEKIEPFNIDKTGYGSMSAWITVDDINQIKVESVT
jgi:ASC-1-like (ASCH) protein